MITYTPGCPCCEVAKQLNRYRRRLVQAEAAMVAIAEVVASNIGYFGDDALHGAAPHQRAMKDALRAALAAQGPFGDALGLEYEASGEDAR